MTVKVTINNETYNSLTTAAKVMGVSKQTLYAKIKAHRTIDGYYCEYLDVVKQNKIINLINNNLNPLIKELDLPRNKSTTRINRVLNIEKITTLNQLISKSEADLFKNPGFGHKSLNILKEVLAKKGLSLYK